MKALTFCEAVREVYSQVKVKSGGKAIVEGAIKEYMKVCSKINALKDLYSQPFHPEMLAHLKEEPNFLNYGEKNRSRYEHDLFMWKSAEQKSKILFRGWQINETDGFNYSMILEKSNNDGYGDLLHIGYYIEDNAYSLHNGTDSVEFPSKPITLDDFICDCKRAGISLFWTDNVIHEIVERIIEHSA
jgi:hypothetical protein